MDDNGNLWSFDDVGENKPFLPTLINEDCELKNDPGYIYSIDSNGLINLHERETSTNFKYLPMKDFKDGHIIKSVNPEIVKIEGISNVIDISYGGPRVYIKDINGDIFYMNMISKSKNITSSIESHYNVHKVKKLKQELYVPWRTNSAQLFQKSARK